MPPNDSVHRAAAGGEAGCCRSGATEGSASINIAFVLFAERGIWRPIDVKQWFFDPCMS
jgi:hypothetical protein